jgi:hypothetical protein
MVTGQIRILVKQAVEMLQVLAHLVQLSHDASNLIQGKRRSIARAFLDSDQAILDDLRD